MLKFRQPAGSADGQDGVKWRLGHIRIVENTPVILKKSRDRRAGYPGSYPGQSVAPAGVTNPLFLAQICASFSLNFFGRYPAGPLRLDGTRRPARLSMFAVLSAVPPDVAVNLAAAAVPIRRYLVR